MKQSKLEMLASFHIFDINKDGFVDASELKRTLTSMGESLTEEEAEVLLRTADTNGDGKIDYKGRGNRDTTKVGTIEALRNDQFVKIHRWPF